jgi:superfamily II DNA helicase RecQ
MRCKIFSVPLGSESSLDRERKLNEFLSANSPKRVFASIANTAEGPVWSVLFFCEDEAQISQKATASAGVPQDSGAPLSGEQVRWIVALKKWRADQAAQEGVPLYMVAQNKWLEEMVRMPVRALDDLQKVRGLGEWRAQKYGAKILEILSGSSAPRRSWPAPTYSSGQA